MTRFQNNNLLPINVIKGDLLILERRYNVNAGEIVLVLHNGHHVFLRAALLNGRVVLQSLADGGLHSSAVEVVGVIKGVVRKY
jgi:SOS-response transcriptional repressor LexA